MLVQNRFESKPENDFEASMSSTVQDPLNRKAHVYKLRVSGQHEKALSVLSVREENAFWWYDEMYVVLHSLNRYPEAYEIGMKLLEKVRTNPSFKAPYRKDYQRIYNNFELLSLPPRNGYIAICSAHPSAFDANSVRPETILANILVKQNYNVIVFCKIPKASTYSFRICNPRYVDPNLFPGAHVYVYVFDYTGKVKLDKTQGVSVNRKIINMTTDTKINSIFLDSVFREQIGNEDSHTDNIFFPKT